MPLLKFTAVCISAFLLNAKSGALLSEIYAKRAFAAHKVTKIILFRLQSSPTLAVGVPFVYMKISPRLPRSPRFASPWHGRARFG